MMEELNYFIRLEIKQLKEDIFINQAEHISNLPKKFKIENAKIMGTPMSSSIKLDKNEQGKSIDSTIYESMIDSLLYLITSRLDIMFSICLCAKGSHLSVVKRIFKYLKGTTDLDLWSLKSNNFELIDFFGC